MISLDVYQHRQTLKIFSDQLLVHLIYFQIVVRRLPASMKENDFLESVSPLPDYDYFHFAEADQTLAQYGLGRYINAFAYCKILVIIL